MQFGVIQMELAWKQSRCLEMNAHDARRSDAPVYHVPVDPAPTYPGPQVSTKPAAQNVPTDPGYKATIFGKDSVSLTCKNCFNQVKVFKLNYIKLSSIKCYIK